jgi:hypothetical protein
MASSPIIFRVEFLNEAREAPRFHLAKTTRHRRGDKDRRLTIINHI